MSSYHVIVDGDDHILHIRREPGLGRGFFLESSAFDGSRVDFPEEDFDGEHGEEGGGEPDDSEFDCEFDCEVVESLVEDDEVIIHGGLEVLGDFSGFKVEVGFEVFSRLEIFGDDESEDGVCHRILIDWGGFSRE